MPKYTEEIKNKAVEAAKSGMALKTIQTTIGPNPKANLRYLTKAGIDYKELRDKLKAEGKLQGVTKKQETKKGQPVAKQATAPVVEKKVE